MSSDTAGTWAAAPDPELASLAPSTTAVIRAAIPVAGLRDFFDASFRVLPQVLAAQQVSVLSPALAAITEWPAEPSIWRSGSSPTGPSGPRKVSSPARCPAAVAAG
jgi:hypothetical protein